MKVKNLLLKFIRENLPKSFGLARSKMDIYDFGNYKEVNVIEVVNSSLENAIEGKFVFLIESDEPLEKNERFDYEGKVYEVKGYMTGAHGIFRKDNISEYVVQRIDGYGGTKFKTVSLDDMFK